ncbi:uncharacterized protein J8A68_003754 [[Candida] subhashii]|uniref:Uncharacterized protein n=1 Tax=[Candida] subhashii TaxID=561895 RepID=A0A8J5QUN4_9ASCO|nr:uncharacterized protein J8A68_003754 [[Candida] subhashii]KAG7662695.1 hypothetical protein J8A68_003754 [[Candida] subhashii]
MMQSNIEFGILNTPISNPNNPTTYSRRTSNFFPSPSNNNHNTATTTTTISSTINSEPTTNTHTHHRLMSPPNSSYGEEYHHKIAPVPAFERQLLNGFDFENMRTFAEPAPVSHHFKQQQQTQTQRQKQSVLDWSSPNTLSSPILENHFGGGGGVSHYISDIQSSSQSLNFALNEDMNRLSLQSGFDFPRTTVGSVSVNSRSLNYNDRQQQQPQVNNWIWSDNKPVSVPQVSVPSVSVSQVSTLKLGSSLFEDTDHIFSPFFVEEEEEEKVEKEENAATMGNGNEMKKMNGDAIERRTRKKREKGNRYSEKVNNPAFIPNGITDPPKKKKEVIPSTPKAKVESKKVIIVDTKKPKKKNIRHNNTPGHHSYSKLENEAIIPFNKVNVKLNLPQKTATTRQDIKSHDFFIRDMILAPESMTNRYSEDYCSTFYKRNIHGYMFTKEPSNSLKVSNTGNKSWVQLKIDLIPGERKFSRKLKVDVKELPIWKPINLNSTIGHNSSRKSNNSPNKKKWGSSASKEYSKSKATNSSRRFGKRSVSA